MSQLFLNMKFMKTLAWSVIAPRHIQYSEDVFRDLNKSYPHLITTHPKITNSHQQKLNCTIMASVYENGPCIIYLHALGSNRTQGLLTLKYLPKQTSLVVFDFSGSGKSEGEYISYGNKEKQDLETVLLFLRKHYCFKNFIVWGRSMGAVTAIMHNREYNPPDVSLLILDSPFHSFEEIAKDIVRQKVPNLPQFLIDSLISVLRFACRKIEYNPFDIDFSNIKILTTALFVYSQIDSIINCEHIFKIIRNYSGVHDSICIKQDHNQIRCPEFYRGVVQKMQYLGERKDKQKQKDKLKWSSIWRKSRGIELTVENRSVLGDISMKLNTERVTMRRSKIRISNRSYQM